MQDYIEGKKEYKVIETRTYQTVYGPWTYTTIADNQFNSDKDMLMLGTLESYMKVREKLGNDKNLELLPIYIEVPDNIRLKRAVEREEKQKEPKYVELCRRFIADSKDFSEENLKKAEIQRRFENLNLDECVNQIIEYIENKEKKRF
jgi:guanylate kinase